MIGASEIAELLQKTAIFGGLTDSELLTIAARASYKKFSAGQVLFNEGESCEGLYVIAKGAIRIFKMSGRGREQVLAVEGPGNSVAEIPVFDGGGYPASAAAAGNAELIFVSRAEFQAICLERPEVALKVLQAVGARLRKLVGIIEELSFTTVRRRLIAYIIRSAKEEGQETPRGISFTMNGSHQELAARIGTVRELVSRNLARLQAEGLIQMESRQITVTDWEGLEEEHAAIV